MNITVTLWMSREKIQRNKKENNSLSILAKNKFILYFFKIKRMRINAKEKQFIINGKKN